MRMLLTVALGLASLGAFTDMASAAKKIPKADLQKFCDNAGGLFSSSAGAGYSCFVRNIVTVTCGEDSMCDLSRKAAKSSKPPTNAAVNGGTPVATAAPVAGGARSGSVSSGTGKASGAGIASGVASPKPAPSKTNIKLSGAASDASVASSKTNTKPVLSNAAKPPLLWGGSAFGTRAGQSAPPRQLQ